MLVQVREDGTTWLISQHDHALFAGQLAMAWGHEPFMKSERHHLLAMAISLHDIAWHEIDDRPLLNAATKLPHSVFDYPVEPRPPIFSRGIAEAERVHPYVGLIDSLHYTSFPFLADHVEFQATEAERQARMRARLDAMGLWCGGLDALAEGDLKFLQLMDRLSLHVCNLAPGSAARNLPPWDDRSDIWENWNGCVDERVFQRVPPGTSIPPLTLEWEGSDRLTLTPFPLTYEVTATIPYRRLHADAFESMSDLREKWVVSEVGTFTLTVAAK